MTKALTAQQIKGILIDYLIDKHSSNITIATEVPFISTRRWADALLIRKNVLHAFEIKGSLDSLAKLKAQTYDYLNTFDYVSLVVSTKHLAKAKQHISPYVGIIVIDDNTEQLKQLRIPTKRQKKLKENLLNFMWREDLLRALRGISIGNKQRTETSHLREQVGKRYTAKEIHKMALGALNGRYAPRYKSFLRERGKKTLVEDLSLLTNKKSNFLF